MTQEQFGNLKVGDIVSNSHAPGRTWVLVRKNDELGGWDIVLQSPMLQITRMATINEWDLYSTIIERRRWY